MKICYDLRGFNVSLQKTGIGWCVYELISQLARQSSPQIRGFNNVTNPSILEIKNLFKLKIAGVPIHRSFLPDKIHQLLWDKGIKSFSKFDVFHSPWQNFYLPNTQNHTLNIYSIYDLTTITHQALHHPNNQATEIIIRKNVARCHGVIADSENTKNDVQRILNFPREKIEVIYPPLREIFRAKNIRPRLSIHYPYWLFVGTLEPRKNIITIIKAFNLFKLHRVFRNYRLILVGKNGWKNENIFQAIKKSRYRQDIIWLKYVSENDLAFLYRQAKIFVYPSLYEGFGMPVMEAMSSGCPVVTANNSSLREIAQNSSLLLNDPENFEELTDYAQKIVIDQHLRNELINQGKKRVQELSGNYGQQHLKFYQQLLNEK